MKSEKLSKFFSRVNWYLVVAYIIAFIVVALFVALGVEHGGTWWHGMITGLIGFTLVVLFALWLLAQR